VSHLLDGSQLPTHLAPVHLRSAFSPSTMAAMTTMLSQQTRPLAPATAGRATSRAVAPAVFGLQRPSLRVQVHALPGCSYPVADIGVIVNYAAAVCGGPSPEQLTDQGASRPVAAMDHRPAVESIPGMCSVPVGCITVKSGVCTPQMLSDPACWACNMQNEVFKRR